MPDTVLIFVGADDLAAIVDLSGECLHRTRHFEGRRAAILVDEETVAEEVIADVLSKVPVPVVTGV